jgi:uncharacterized protein (DUF486 family)
MKYIFGGLLAIPLMTFAVYGVEKKLNTPPLLSILIAATCAAVSNAGLALILDEEDDA